MESDFSSFLRLGDQAIVTYENNQPVVYNQELGIYESGTPTGETSYNSNETIETFGNLEPRISFSYQLNNSSS